MALSSPVSSSTLPMEWRYHHDLFICRLSAHPDLLTLEDIIGATREAFPELQFARLTETAIDVRLQILELRGAGLFADIEHEGVHEGDSKAEQDAGTDDASLLLSPRILQDTKGFYREKNESEPVLRATTPAEQRMVPRRGITYAFYPKFEGMTKSGLAECFYLIPDEEPGVVGWMGTKLRVMETEQL